MKKKKDKVEWDDRFYIKSYQLVRSGATRGQVAVALGVSMSQFRKWVETRPALAEIFDEKEGLLQNDYIYGELTGPSKKVWDDICKARKEPNAVRRMEALFGKEGEGIRKECFLHALTKSHLNPTEACRKVGIPYKVYKKWMEEDKEFISTLDEIHEHKGNLYEEEFTKLVMAGDTAAVIHANRTYNRKRGYGDKLEVEHSGKVVNEYVFELGEELLSRLSKPIRKELLQVVEQIQIEQKELTNGDTKSY